MIKLAVSDVLPQAGQKDIDLGLVGAQPTQPVLLAGQSEALRMMLRNLLDNAVKYTPRSGRVDLTLELESAEPAQGDRKAAARLVIEDSGPGIAPEDQARVFNRFVRTSHATAEPGSGLGLAIANVIAVRHGATIVLGSSSRLGGLKAELRFPLAAPHSRP